MSAIVVPLAAPFFCAVVSCAIFFCAVGARAQVQNPAVRSVEIKSTLSSFGGRRKILKDSDPPKTLDDKQETDLVFEKKDGVYYLKGKGEGEDKAVDASLIAGLAKAVTGPANPEPNAEDLGITPEWLKANAPSVAKKFTTTWIGGRPVHVDLVESAFADPATIDRAIQTLFHQHTYCSDCTHYFQSVRITVTFEDNTNLTANSSSEHPYMLPWNVGEGTGTVAYNAAISRAVVALLPEKSANRALLAGENIDSGLGNIVMREEENETHLREVESKTGGTLSAIRAKYTIDSANIGEGKDYGLGVGEAGQDLVLRLTAADLPPAFKDDVALAYVDGKVVGAEKFLSDGPKFEKLVLSVPWLNQFIQDHPKTPIALRFVHGTSLSESELKNFSADMRAIGQEKIISKVDAAKDRVALLMVGQGMTNRSEWLVFPDKHMLLWRSWRIPGIGGAMDSVAWDSSQYSAKPCADGTSNFVQCVGREVSASGSLLPGQ